MQATIIENTQRLDPDEVSQWESFTRLIQKEGRTIEQIEQTFGLTELYVRRVLALGNLLPRIRNLYRRGEINMATIRHLTLATKAQQKDWLALLDDPEHRAPTGDRLKAWLFGGESISVKAAIFPLGDYGGKIVGDLFEQDGFFADAETFWTSQNEAIAAKRDAYLADGWTDVEIMEPGSYFYSYEHEKTPKAKGGKVFISVRHNGEVEINEGWLSGKDARKARVAAAKAETTEADRKAAQAARPETTSTLQTYIDLLTHIDGHPITSRAGAMGLMQVMAATYAAMRALHRLGPDPYDPHDNIMAGAAYLRAMHDQFGYPGLFAAYNAGPGRYAEHLRTGKPLADETRDYIAQLARTPATPSMPPAILSGTRLFFTLGGASNPAPDALESMPEKPVRSDLFVPLSVSPGGQR